MIMFRNGNETKSSRIVALDIVRSLCMIWIICFWHITTYTYIEFTDAYTSAFTVGSMGCFVFISGILLGKKKVENIEGIKNFYVNRFFRIWPMFFFACTLLLIVKYVSGMEYISSIKQYLLTIMGMVAFFPPMPKTVWFASVIILFYILTPIILFFNKKRSRVVVSFLFYVLFLVGYFLLNSANELLLFFPFYAVGLICSDEICTLLRKGKIVIEMLITCACFILWLWVGKETAGSSAFQLQYVNILFCIGFVFGISCILAHIQKFDSIWLWLSYSSFSAYLFHRVILGVIVFFFGKVNQWVCYLVVLPIFFLISYLIQFVYDALIDRCIFALDKHR